MPVPGWRLRISLAASMPSRWKVGRHADVADDDLGLVLGGRGQQLGVVGGLAHDLDVGLAAQQRAHAGAHEQVVVGQHHRDHAVGHGVHPVTPDGSGRGGSHATPGEGQPHPCDARQSPLGSRAASRGWGQSDATRSSAMKIESRVVAVSWIPSEAVKGAMKAPFELGIAHYDEPLPDVLGDLDDWRKRDMFRVANDLRAWIGVDDDGQITGHGYSAGGVIGSTTMGLGSANATFQAVAYPTLQPEPEVGDGWVRFQQTAGGRTGVPAPRRVAKPPFVQYHAPDGLVDAVAHDPRRRPLRVRPRRRQPVPPPLGVRPRRQAGRQVRPGRLQGLVPPRLRRLQPVGRRGLAGARRRGRVGDGAAAVAGDHGRGEAQGPQAEGGRGAHHPGRGGGRHLPAARRRHPGERRRRGDRQPRPGRADRRAGGPRGRRSARPRWSR